MQAARSFQHSRSAEPVKGMLAALVLRTLDGTCLTPSGVSTWPLAWLSEVHLMYQHFGQHSGSRLGDGTIVTQLLVIGAGFFQAVPLG
jgi:hypothetical protein